MADLIYPPIETEPDTLAQLAYDFLQSYYPDWDPNDGNFATRLFDAMAQVASDLKTMASDVPPAIFRAFGKLINVNPVEATPAQGESTWVVKDNLGYTIPAGVFVGIAAAGDDVFAFEVDEDVVIAPGTNTTGVGEVVLVAIDAGSEANALTADPELQDALEYVDSITLEAATSGGTDAEDDDVYLARLRERLTLLSARPILPNDFAILARDIAGVWRSTAIDLYDPDTDTYDNERYVTVAVVDADGEVLDAPTKAAVSAYLEAMRETNFVVPVIDPTYTEFDVDYEVMAMSGRDGPTVKAAVDAAIAAYLSPAAWGLPAGTNERGWSNENTVRYNELISLIDRVAGEDFVQNLTFGIHGDPLDVVDIVMDGPAPLPRINTITGVVNTP